MFWRFFENYDFLRQEWLLIAPPGATFLPNPRSTVDFHQTVTSGKIVISIMFETMVGEMRTRLQSSPSHCGLPQACTEGFWSEIPRRPISWSCWSTLKMFNKIKFPRSGPNIRYIENYPDTTWIGWIIVDLTPVNHSKQFQMELLFTLFRQHLPGSWGRPQPLQGWF